MVVACYLSFVQMAQIILKCDGGGAQCDGGGFSQNITSPGSDQCSQRGVSSQWGSTGGRWAVGLGGLGGVFQSCCVCDTTQPLPDISVPQSTPWWRPDCTILLQQLIWFLYVQGCTSVLASFIWLEGSRRKWFILQDDCKATKNKLRK